MFNVLVVDDSSIDIMLLEDIVKTSLPFSQNIDTYTDSVLALDAFYKNSYQLVITDIEMPLLDGFEFIEKIKPTTKGNVIAVSGCEAPENPNESILDAANCYGADYAVSKKNLYANLSALLTKLYNKQH
ncbi:response regulator [Thalassotalea sp. 1_MG-2023]|uniref:response regulator n=1 Tax=Thalassotalea sp. 1_MG-2023 TaxID=3062680 RepID=UPI0026E36421|nr:response regulator [Thalassotalea sp. 1_MG-2023]MDO6428751.1 response regulator [Thalassotalea sp. 1_MG-2023]